jgi:LacI family transcriptional regulator
MKKSHCEKTKFKFSDPHHVTIAVGSAVVSGRNALSGILRYISTGKRWNINVIQNFDRLAEQDMQKLLDRGTDGFIVGLPEAQAALPTLLQSPIPTIVTVFPNNIPVPRAHRRSTVFLDVDNSAIGTKAAAYFMERGTFRSFAFISTCPTYRWSILRQKAFTEHLSRHGHKVHLFNAQQTLRDGQPDVAALTAFLLSLQKPAAVFAAYDVIALQIIEICQSNKISVPLQMAVLGVDNDDVLCHFTRPTISSIDAGHEELGFRAAEILDGMMAGAAAPESPVIIPFPSGNLVVTERESTKKIPPAGHLVREILAYINRNAASGITVCDVVNHLGVSRRLAELRFRQIQGDSIGQAIIRARLNEIRRRLTQRRQSISDIAASCGFSGPSSLSHFMKTHLGVSPNAFRKHESSNL